MLARLQRALLFPAHDRVPQPHAGDDVPGLERWWLPTEEGAVEAFWLPALTGEGRRPAIFFAHGNGELIDDWPLPMQAFRERGFHVLLAEYRGYGRSAGRASEATVRGDFVRLYDRMRAHPTVDPAACVLMGRSLGGGAVCQVFAERDACVLVLMSTFTSVTELAGRLFRLPARFVADRFDSVEVLRRKPARALHVHGRHDELIPFENAEALARITGGPLVADDGGHNDTPLDWPAFVQRVVEYVDASRC
ncbi:MAG: alpha/beta hydrolase [Polyangiales bacterium]|nr:alpha/beta hydrolase [Myxococcales bacterium]